MKETQDKQKFLHSCIPLHQPTIDELKKIYKDVNFSSAIIPPKTLKKIPLNTKIILFLDMLAAGYIKITCQCREKYVGMTKRNLKTRVRDAKSETPVSGLSQDLKISSHKIVDTVILKKTE